RKTVLLCSGAEITLEAPLVILQGTTLITAGRPTDAADMATIRVGTSFPAQAGIIVRGSGSDIHLISVRFDGNRRAVGPRDNQALVEIGPGDGYEVSGWRFTDAPGWTHLHFLEGCTNAIVTDNVVESATRPHDDGGHWSDGMSIACAHSVI